MKIIDCTPFFAARRCRAERERQPKAPEAPLPTYEALWLLDVPAKELVPLLEHFGYRATFSCNAWTVRRKPDGAA
jgi:hypothetical protein